MPTTIRARYANGVLTPLEPLELSEGCEVSLTVNGADDAPAVEEEPFLDFIRRFRLDRAQLPDDYPTDGAKNYKHYLYGHPKED